jgi:hypothetical protein
MKQKTKQLSLFDYPPGKVALEEAGITPFTDDEDEVQFPPSAL